MTLINFLTRVHFADGVLEEALHSELEANGKRRPLVIAADPPTPDIATERFFLGFPRGTDPVIYSDVPALITEAAVRAVADLFRERECDVIVAYGANRVIDLAKAARIAIAIDEPLHALSVGEGGSRRINGGLPDLYAVPGMQGYDATMSEYVRVTLSDGQPVLFSSRSLIPCIAICDPTLTLNAPMEEAAHAAAGVMAGAIDSFLSPRYHPPADGLALDALSRIWANMLPALDNDNLPARRELMAAGLNGALSLQKGLCVIHALGNAVALASKSADPSSIGGVVIPHLIDLYEDRLEGRSDAIKYSLRIDERRSLPDGLRDMLADWPIPKSLSDLGVPMDALDAAADIAARDFALISGPRSFHRCEIRNVLARAH